MIQIHIYSEILKSNKFLNNVHSIAIVNMEPYQRMFDDIVLVAEWLD